MKSSMTFVEPMGCFSVFVVLHSPRTTRYALSRLVAHDNYRGSDVFLCKTLVQQSALFYCSGEKLPSLLSV